MKINCVIVDDEPENLKYLQQIVEDINDVVIVKSFTDANSFLSDYKNISFDMCILDNHLPDGKGLELARSLTQKKIIFVSAHDISAYEAYDVNAIDVLKKPVDSYRLKYAIKKCRDKIMNEKGFVLFATEHGKTRFKLEDIVYIETITDCPNKKIITKVGDTIKTGKLTFPEILQKLPADIFCQINASTILNTNYFKTLGKENRIKLTFDDNTKSPSYEYCNDKYLSNFKKLVGLD